MHTLFCNPDIRTCCHFLSGIQYLMLKLPNKKWSYLSQSTIIWHETWQNYMRFHESYAILGCLTFPLILAGRGGFSYSGTHKIANQRPVIIFTCTFQYSIWNNLKHLLLLNFLRCKYSPLTFAGLLSIQNGARLCPHHHIWPWPAYSPHPYLTLAKKDNLPSSVPLACGSPWIWMPEVLDTNQWSSHWHP